MDVVIAGGHGQIALRLEKLLAARGDTARGLIRNPDHAADLEAVGARPVAFDLESEDDLSPWLEGADAVVFAAGAGPGSGAARKQTMDLGGAVKLIEAARSAGGDALRDDQLHRRGPPGAGLGGHEALPGREGRAPTRRSRAAGWSTRSSGPAVSPTTRARGA